LGMVGSSEPEAGFETLKHGDTMAEVLARIGLRGDVGFVVCGSGAHFGHRDRSVRLIAIRRFAFSIGA
jgi:hypothetical protein